jgi:hypothetical protein
MVFHYKYAALLFSWTICLMYVYFSYSHLNCQEWGDSSFPKMVFIFFSLLDQTHTSIVLYCILTSCVKLTSCSSIQHDCGHVHNMYLNDFNLLLSMHYSSICFTLCEYHYGYFSKHSSFKITWNVSQLSNISWLFSNHCVSKVLWTVCKWSQEYAFTSIEFKVITIHTPQKLPHLALRFSI